MRASWGPVQQEATEVFCVSTRREIGRGVRRSSCVTRARAHTVRTDVSYKPIRNPPPNTISPHIYRKEKCPPYAIRRGFVFITAKKKKQKQITPSGTRNAQVLDSFRPTDFRVPFTIFTIRTASHLPDYHSTNLVWISTFR